MKHIDPCSGRFQPSAILFGIVLPLLVSDGLRLGLRRLDLRRKAGFGYVFIVLQDIVVVFFDIFFRCLVSCLHFLPLFVARSHGFHHPPKPIRNGFEHAGTLPERQDKPFPCGFQEFY